MKAAQLVAAFAAAALAAPMAYQMPQMLKDNNILVAGELSAPHIAEQLLAMGIVPRDIDAAEIPGKRPHTHLTEEEMEAVNNYYKLHDKRPVTVGAPDIPGNNPHVHLTKERTESLLEHGHLPEKRSNDLRIKIFDLMGMVPDYNPELTKDEMRKLQRTGKLSMKELVRMMLTHHLPEEHRDLLELIRPHELPQYANPRPENQEPGTPEPETPRPVDPHANDWMLHNGWGVDDEARAPRVGHQERHKHETRDPMMFPSLKGVDWKKWAAQNGFKIGEKHEFPPPYDYGGN